MRVAAAPAVMDVMKVRESNMNQMLRILGKRGRITIPYEIRQNVGFKQNDVLSFTEAPDGKSVLVKREKICDNCRTDVASRKKEESNSGMLFDFLNGLSDEQQCAALYHLSLKWADKHGGKYARA